MMGSELRQAFRSLFTRPGRTLVVLTTLALGIGANGAVASLAHAVFLEALPYPEAHRIVVVESTRNGRQNPISYLNYLDLRRGLVADPEPPIFEQLAVLAQKPFNVMVGGEAVHADTALVSAEYFALLGHEPELGRVFTTEEDALPRGHHVAISSHGFWRRHFEGRDFADGITIRINGEPFELVGVMAPGFRDLTETSDLWVPVTSSATLLGAPFLEERAFAWFGAVGRLAEGQALSGAGVAAAAVMARLEEEFPDANRGRELRLKTLREASFGELSTKVRGLAASSVFVLLLACANVSGLLWARAVERRREIAMRGALGAPRWRLVRQLLTESAVLALLSSLAALVLVRWVLDGFLASAPLDLHGFMAVETGPAVIAGVLLLGMSTSLLFGLLPALGATRFDLRRELAEGGGGGARGGPRIDLLAVAEVALAFVLLYGALFVALRFQHLSRSDLGYRTDRLVTLRVNLWEDQYASQQAKAGVGGRLLAGLRETPEVEAVALVGPFLPGEEKWQTRRMTVENWSGDPADATSYFQVHYVSTGYFEMMEIEFIDGRPFQRSDWADRQPVLVVSAAAAQRCWPDQNPVGHRLRLGAADAGGSLTTVVGLVDDLAESGFARGGSGQPHIYFYMAQIPPAFPPTLNVLLRTAREPDTELLEQLRDAVQAVVPDLPAYDVRTLESRLEAQLAGDRFLVRLTGCFTLLALVLAAAGIYGLASYRVVSRARELGIRLALGCRPSGLFRRTLGQGLGLTLSGCVIGSVLTLAAILVLESRVDEVFLEPSLLVVVAALLVGLGLAATAWPAGRASRVDPMSTLREE